ncbi:MAG: virulence factor TspB C-terminal domain-related protein [Cellvibrio sp.]
MRKIIFLLLALGFSQFTFSQTYADGCSIRYNFSYLIGDPNYDVYVINSRNACFNNTPNPIYINYGNYQHCVRCNNPSCPVGSQFNPETAQCDSISSSSSSDSQTCPTGQGLNESNQCVQCLLGVGPDGKCISNSDPSCPENTVPVPGVLIDGYPICTPDLECPEGHSAGIVDGVVACYDADNAQNCPEGGFWGSVDGGEGCWFRDNANCPNGGFWGTFEGVTGCHGVNHSSSSAQTSSAQTSSAQTSSGQTSSGNNSGGDGSGTGGDGDGDGDGSGTGGDGSGSGSSGSQTTSSSGSASPSNGCSAPPTCVGDAIYCAMLQQIYQGQCGGTESVPDFDPEAAYNAYQSEFESVTNESKNNHLVNEDGTLKQLDPETIDITEDDRIGFYRLEQAANASGGGSCPAPRTLNIALGSFEISYEFFCSLAEQISPFVLFLFGFISSKIIYRALSE